LFAGSSAKRINATESYRGKDGPTQGGIVVDAKNVNWSGLANQSKSGLKPFDVTWTGSSVVGGLGAINNSGNDIHCFLGGPRLIKKKIFGSEGNIAGCATRGASQFALFTYDAKPMKFGTNNTEAFQIDQHDQTIYTSLGKKWGGTHGAGATIGQFFQVAW